MTSMHEAGEEVAILKQDSLGRVRTNPEQRDAILEEFDRSGMSGAAFARHHGIKYQTFAAWRQRRNKRRGERESMTGSEGGLQLAELVLSEGEASGQGGLTIELPGGARIILGDMSQVRMAAAVIEAVSQRR